MFSLEISELIAFFEFSLIIFTVVFGSNRLQKTLEGKVTDWVIKKKKEKKEKEKDLLNRKYKVTFQPDGCVQCTCVATCFIYRSRPIYDTQNIQFRKTLNHL